MHFLPKYNILQNGNGGLRGAGAGRLHGKFWEFLGIFERDMGAPLYTPWVCMPLSGLARRQICRWEKQQYPRAFRGLSGGQNSPPDRLQQRRNRYLAFFCQAFFSPGKKSGKAGASQGFDDDDTVAAFI